MLDNAAELAGLKLDHVVTRIDTHLVAIDQDLSGVGPGSGGLEQGCKSLTEGLRRDLAKICGCVWPRGKGAHCCLTT